MSNKSDRAGEINLDNAAGAVVGEIETLGPATTADMTADLGRGTYTFRCYHVRPAGPSRTVQVTGQRTARARRRSSRSPWPS